MTTTSTPDALPQQVVTLLDRVTDPVEAALTEATELASDIISALEDVTGKKGEQEDLATARYAADELYGLLDELRSHLDNGGAA